MQSYLHQLMNGSSMELPTLDKMQEALRNLEQDNSVLEKELASYEQKISQLPLQMRHKIQQQQYLPSEGEEMFSEVKQSFDEQDEGQESSPNPFTSMVDKGLLQEKLNNLQKQEEQIDYVSKLSDMYIRCHKGQQSGSKGDKSTQEVQELEEIAQFIESIRPYDGDSDSLQQDNGQYDLVNDLVSNIQLHTSKKLTQKCENLIHYGPSGSMQKVIIQKFLIKNCKSIILGQVLSANNKNDKDIKIVNKFLEKILGDVIYYDVSYQKIIFMQVVDPKLQQEMAHQEVINRKKVYFFPSETQKHFDSIIFTLTYHLDKVKQLKSILLPGQSKQFEQMFDKTVERHILMIKSNLEYILPYINIKSRKQIMAVLADGKDEVIEFEDLVLRLKFKGQDGDMFMNNLDAVFGRLLEVSKDEQSDQTEKIQFNDKNFSTLTSFFELGIFQAEQSLLQTSSKAIKKLTTSFTARNNFQKPPSKLTSKKLFNMIFFSVSNLIERFDELLDREEELFGKYSRGLGMTYEEKSNEWIDKLIEIREGVRKRIHEE